MPPVPVPEVDLDSVEKLSQVFKSVYVMQNISDQTTFRFGCMGTRTTKNSAIQRLGQCTSWEGHQRKDGEQTYDDAWRYIAMATFEPNTQPTIIRDFEKRIRTAYFKGKPPAFVRIRKRVDRFQTNDLKKVISLFRNAIAP